MRTHACVFRDMVRAGVVPVGEGVMRLSGRDDNDSNARHALDVLEDGYDGAMSQRTMLVKRCSRVLLRVVRGYGILLLHSGIMREFYERIFVSCADTTIERL